MNNNKCTVIGPFLGPRGDAGVEIFIGLPGKENESILKLTCKVFVNENEVRAVDCTLEGGDPYRLFYFK